MKYLTKPPLFQDLSTTDLTRELWLVAWVIRVGRWAGAGSSGSGTGERRGPVARRPLGAGVLPLADFLRQPGQHPGEKEYTFKVSGMLVTDGGAVKARVNSAPLM